MTLINTDLIFQRFQRSSAAKDLGFFTVALS